MSDEFEPDHFHDVVAEILHDRNIKDKELLTDYNLRKFYDMLPQHIIDEAKAWGHMDSVFRDNAYVWLRDNWDAALKAVSVKNNVLISMAIVTYVKVEAPEGSNPEDIMHTISDNVDYNFTYNSDGIRIVDTEIMEVVLQ